MKRTRTLVIVALLTAPTAACDLYGSDDRQKAAEAQQEATREASEARNEEAEKAADIRKDVAEDTAALQKDYARTVAEGERETAEAHAEANSEVARAQAEANDKIREATADVKAADAELRVWAQKRLDTLDHEIDEVKVKAQTAKPAVLDDFKAGIIDVEAKRDILARDIGSATARDEAAAATVRGGIDKRIDTLKASVDRLSKKL